LKIEKAPNNSFERDACYAAAPHAPLKLTVRNQYEQHMQIDVKIVKSEIPIIWIDTSIITYMAKWKYKLCNLEKVQEERISKLYQLIYDSTRKGALICPYAEQEAEVWAERDKWLDIIHNLSLGIDTLALYDIQMNQLGHFMKAYLDNEKTVTLKYTSAFESDPVDELRSTLKSPFFITARLPILFGKEYQKDLKNNIHRSLEEQRRRNIELKTTFAQQLEQEYIGGLQALFILHERFLSGKSLSDHEQFNAMYGAIDLNYQLLLWKHLCGKDSNYLGLIDFYKSDHYKSMPFTNLYSNLLANLMVQSQPIKSGDVWDIKHASTLLPFSDLFITDKSMSAFLKSKEFGKAYNTTVCYIGDTEIIDMFFQGLVQ
jgi:hypothetical protein